MLTFSIFRPLVYMLYISSVLCLFYLGARGIIHETEFLGQVIDGVGDGTFRQVLDLTPRIASAIIAPGEAELMALTGMLEKEKQLTVGVLAGLSLVLRDALVCKYGGTTTLSTSPEVAAQLAASWISCCRR